MVLEGNACLEAADVDYLAGWQRDGWCCDGVFDGGSRGGGRSVLCSDTEDEGCRRESGRKSDGNHDGREGEAKASRGQ